MQAGSFLSGFAIAAALGIVGAYWIAKQADAEKVHYPSSAFYDDRDDRPNSGYITAQGTILGEDMEGGSFFYLECDHEKGTCRTVDLSSPGSNRTVFLNTDEWPITSWTNKEVIVESKPVPAACNRVKLVIDRETKFVQYIRIPQATRSMDMCKAFTNKVLRWELGNRPV